MSNLDIASYNRRQQVFTAANVSAKSVIAVTTAMTGVILYNPAGSNKKALLVDCGFVWTTVPGAVHNIGIAIAPPNATAPSSLTAIGSGVLLADGSSNAGNAVCRAYDAATLAVAPVAQKWLGGAAWGSSVGVSPYDAVFQLDGSIILVPGAVACLTVVTTTAVGMGHFTWIEVPA